MASTSAVVPSPSAFATLLRRSKFASFDPQIGQIYATYDGHAYRGDWGLKRPLSNRRRDGRIVVKKVDTAYQQTEWKSAYLDSLWMKKQEELTVTPTLADSSEWASYVGGHSRAAEWVVDSDYAKDIDLDGVVKRKDAVPNPLAMTERQFKRYLQQVRDRSSAFPEFLERMDELSDERRKTLSEQSERSRKSKKPIQVEQRPYDMISIARRLDSVDFNSSTSQRFIAEQQIVPRSSVQTAPVINQLPHPNAGLSYTHVPALQNYYFSKPLPGRRLVVAYERYNSAEKSSTVNVSIAGWVAQENIPARQKKSLTDFGEKDVATRSNKEAGTSMFKVINQYLNKAPLTVGKYPKGLEGAEINMEVLEQNAPLPSSGVARRNPFTPGSREYVAFVEGKVAKVEPIRPKKKKHTDVLADFKNRKSKGRFVKTMEKMQSSLAKGRESMTRKD